MPSPAGAGQVVKNDSRHAHGHCAARKALFGARVRLLPGHLRWAPRQAQAPHTPCLPACLHSTVRGTAEPHGRRTAGACLFRPSLCSHRPVHALPLAHPAAPGPIAPLAAGVGLFGLKSSSKVTRKLASPNAPLGYTLCLVNLVLDGYTNAAQVRACSARAAAIPPSARGRPCMACPRGRGSRRVAPSQHSVAPHQHRAVGNSRMAAMRRPCIWAGILQPCLLPVLPIAPLHGRHPQPNPGQRGASVAPLHCHGCQNGGTPLMARCHAPMRHAGIRRAPHACQASWLPPALGLASCSPSCSSLSSCTALHAGACGVHRRFSHFCPPHLMPAPVHTL